MNIDAPSSRPLLPPPAAELVLSGTSTLTVRDVAAMLWLRKGIIALVAGGVFGVACFLTLYLLSPMYGSDSSIIINPNHVSPMVDAMPQSDFEKIISFQTQIDVVKSRALAMRTVDTLDLGRTRVLSRIEVVIAWVRDLRRQLGELLGITKWMRPYNWRVAAIEAVASRIDVLSKPQSSMLVISYRARDPNEAAETLNVLVAHFNEVFNDQINARADGVVRYLEKQLEDVGTRLAAAEQAVLSFKTQDVLVLDPGAEAAPAGPRGAARPARPATSLVGVTDTPKVEEQLKAYVMAMEEEARKLQAQFTVDYPPLVALQAKITRYVRALNQLPQKELEMLQLRRTLEMAQDHYKYINQNLERARLVRVSNTTAIGTVTVFEPAGPDETPLSPKPKVLLPVAAVFGLVLGVLVAALAGYLDRRLYTERDTMARLGLRCFGAIPRR
jgi:uncharacterized protein involved in exopolysaccharide biosynthesis